MSAVENTAGVYDAKHPWISGPHEDPSKANWLDEFFSPFGLTPKPIFLRGQALLWIVRYFVLAISFTMASGVLTHFLPLVPTYDFPGFDGFPLFALIGMILAFLTITGVSVVSHVRRLNDSGRSPLWVMMIIWPTAVSILVGLIVLMGMNQQIGAKPATPTVVEKKVEAPKDEVSTETAAKSEDAKPAARPGRQRKPQPVTRESALQTSMGVIAGLWLFLSFWMMFVSLAFVARGKTVKQDYNPLVR